LNRTYIWNPYVSDHSYKDGKKIRLSVKQHLSESLSRNLSTWEEKHRVSKMLRSGILCNGHSPETQLCWV